MHEDTGGLWGQLKGKPARVPAGRALDMFGAKASMGWSYHQQAEATGVVVTGS